MDIDQAQKVLRQFAADRDWEQFHSLKNLASAMSVEAAELLEHFQWLSESESSELSEKKKTDVAHEMADVFYYLLRLADVLDVNLEDSLEQKMIINAQKYPAEKVRGSAKKYTEYDEQG